MTYRVRPIAGFGSSSAGSRSSVSTDEMDLDASSSPSQATGSRSDKAEPRRGPLLPVLRPPDDRVLVTGATGFLGSEIVRLLLATGYHVRGTTSNMSRARRSSELSAFPGASTHLELVEMRLLDAPSVYCAVRECRYVIHTASPFRLDVADPVEHLVRPAVEGTLTILRAAQDAGVRRLILTSSLAALAGEPPESSRLTETDWNSASSLARDPYAYSKTMAERSAWRAVEQASGTMPDMVVINPSTIIGPSHVGRLNEAHRIFTTIAAGQPAILDIEFQFVDVRDVAAAHLLALESPTSHGRYPMSAGGMSMRSLADFIAQYLDECSRLPRLALDNVFGTGLVRLVMSFLSGGTADYLRRTVGYRYPVDTFKVRHHLGIRFLPMDRSIHDTLTSLEKWGHIRGAHRRSKRR